MTVEKAVIFLSLSREVRRVTAMIGCAFKKNGE
jgi:hypothetical protein